MKKIDNKNGSTGPGVRTGTIKGGLLSADKNDSIVDITKFPQDVETKAEIQ